VCLEAFEDLHHRLLPLSPAVFIGRAFLPGGAGSRVGS
jgi:hypothetical protein